LLSHTTIKVSPPPQNTQPFFLTKDEKLVQIKNVLTCVRSEVLTTVPTIISVVVYICKEVLMSQRGTRWRSWLKHFATSRKVAGSITDGVTGIFYSHNPSGRIMALGSTQPLTEMSTRNVFWG